MLNEGLIGSYQGPLLDTNGNPLINKYNNNKPVDTAWGKYVRIGDDLYVDLSESPSHYRIALYTDGLERKLKEQRRSNPKDVEGGSFKIDNQVQPPEIVLYGSSTWLEEIGFPDATEATQQATNKVWEDKSLGYRIRRGQP